MNEQEILNKVETAETLDEIWQAASEAGIEKEEFDQMVKEAENDTSDELTESDLEDVSGGWYIRIRVRIRIRIRIVIRRRIRW